MIMKLHVGYVTPKFLATKAAGFGKYSFAGPATLVAHCLLTSTVTEMASLLEFSLLTVSSAPLSLFWCFKLHNDKGGCAEVTVKRPPPRTIRIP